MTRTVTSTMILAVLVLILVNIVNRVDEVNIDQTQYGFVINVGNETFYSNVPPQVNGNSIMFVDAVTGKIVVRVAPTIKAESTKPIDNNSK